MSLKSIHDTLTMERERVRQAWTGPELRQNTSEQLATLCGTLSEVTHIPTIVQLTGATTGVHLPPLITFYSPFHTPTHTLFLAYVEKHWWLLSALHKKGAEPSLSVGEELCPKLSSRFGLFPGRTGTSCHRRFLKEHTSSLSLPICTHKQKKNPKHKTFIVAR